MNELAELIEAFRTEGEEILERMEELLLRLEQSPDDDELLHEIFRAAHTIKGNAACFSFDGLTAFAHVVEEVLENLRSGAAEPTGRCISLLLDAVDAMRDLAARAIGGDNALTAQQRALMEALTRESVARSSQSPRPSRDASEQPVWDAAGSTERSVDPAFRPGTGPTEGEPAERATEKTLRVRIGKLNRMLDLTGEIATARGRLRELAAADERILDAVRDLDRLSFDLQELVMSARMVALAPALRPFQRVVRDVAGSQRKRVALVVEAGDVEVDATFIEQLRDPITHMLRNAIDHGIETPEARVAAGKVPTGTIRITAEHDRRGITIRLTDDGRGLDEEGISRRARELGLEPTLDAIFEPGFSTAGSVTDLSGRGVGMDVVRRNVETLRGVVSVASERGRGTTVTIRLPLTVSVIEGFAVAVAGETYVLPIETVAECMVLPESAGTDAFGVLNVRGEVLPFLRLRELFGLRGRSSAGLLRENVVVVQHEHGRAGIVVDELLGTSDTVMKPMGGLLRQAAGVAGSSILGNGRVALVLDAREVIRCATQLQPVTH